jgi:hypothetical protein
MTLPYKLNAMQVGVLQWVADGSPPDVMAGYGYRVSAAALQSRGLIRISGRSKTWRARITQSGLDHLGVQNGHIDAGDSGSRDALRVPSVPLKRSGADGAGSAGPTNLRGAHRLVLATRDAACGLRAGQDGRLRIGPKPGAAHVVVSRPLLRRALLVLHGLTREAIRHGWDVIPYSEPGHGERSGIAITIREHCYPVEIHEPIETIPFTTEEIAACRNRERMWPDADRQPPPEFKRTRHTGRLRLLLPHGHRGGRASWSDGSRGPLERKLASVLRTLAARATADEQASIERARRNEELRRDLQAREERARRARIEDARVERLLAEVKAWRRSADVRDYIAALERQLPTLEDDERAVIADWTAWAKDWAARSDPVRRTSMIVGIDDERDGR